jgi:SNF2 family DNA or RNA helicase
VLKVLRTFRGRALLADEVGLGKTIEAGMLILEFLLRGMARRVLVLAPAALVGQWRGELSEKFGIAAATSEDPLFRSSPEEAWAAEDAQVTVASLQLARSARHAELVRAQRWDLVVVDEAHHVKSRATAGFRLIDSLKSRFLLLLTATPVETELEELYNLVTLLKPGQLSTPAAFKREYIAPGDPFSPRNRERLRSLLSEIMVRNTRALAGRGIELPPRFAETIVVEPTKEEAALYAAVVEAARSSGEAEGGRRLALRVLLEEAGSSPHAVRVTLERMAESGLPAPLVRSLRKAVAEAAAAAPSKAARLLQIVRGLPALAPSSKAVVFTRFRATQEALAAELSRAGIDCSSFDGGMSGPEKDRAVERLRDEVPVMLATDVGGEGRNLQFANVLVNYDLPWNPMKIEQRIGRLHRIGQRREVRVFSLCAKGSAEERILDVLDRRIHLFELVVGEVDLILGRATDEREFEERVFSIYAQAKSEAEVAQGFEEMARALEAARGQYEKVKALDDALFRRDFET